MKKIKIVKAICDETKKEINVLTVDDEVFDIEAPACINIKADKHHGVLALEDCVWFCVHATDETDADKIDEVLIQRQ